MNNQFKILWFEDDPSWYKTALRRVKLSVASHFLQDMITRKSSGDVLNIEELKDAKYDLILMDYKLSNGSPNGDAIIKCVRDNLILTDILFYSSDEKKMISSFRRKIPEMDGVYLAKRNIDEFAEKTGRLISKIVQRSEDIVNLRGMVLEATSSFEMITQNFLSSLISKIIPLEKDYLNTQLKNIVLKGRISRNQDKLNSNIDLDTINKENGLSMREQLNLIDDFSKNKRSDSIRKYFAENKKLLKPDKNKLVKNIETYYMTRIGAFRNALGHLEFGKKIEVNGEEFLVDQNFHRRLRQNINELETDFEHTLNLLLQNNV
ncbi:MAG: hypothetical protein II850_09560 [Fibrobacter sp.]|nr:hypothetical protein [Fibrobacter sp.]